MSKDVRKKIIEAATEMEYPHTVLHSVRNMLPDHIIYGFCIALHARIRDPYGYGIERRAIRHPADNALQPGHRPGIKSSEMDDEIHIRQIRTRRIGCRSTDPPCQCFGILP